MLKYIKQINTRENILYNNILSLSRNKLFYTNCNLIDTFENRVHLIFLHISFIFIKIKQNNEREIYKSFYQKTFDLIFNKIELNMREVGFGVEVVDLAESSVLARCGLEGGDVVLIVNAVRVLRADVVRAVIVAARGRVSLAWVRAVTLMRGEVGPGPPDMHLRSPD